MNATVSTFSIKQIAIDFKEITEETFKKVFTNSPLKRIQWEGLKRNVKFLKQ